MQSRYIEYEVENKPMRHYLEPFQERHTCHNPRPDPCDASVCMATKLQESNRGSSILCHASMSSFSSLKSSSKVQQKLRRGFLKLKREKCPLKRASGEVEKWITSSRLKIRKKSCRPPRFTQQPKISHTGLWEGIYDGHGRTRSDGAVI